MNVKEIKILLQAMDKSASIKIDHFLCKRVRVAYVLPWPLPKIIFVNSFLVHDVTMTPDNWNKLLREELERRNCAICIAIHMILLMGISAIFWYLAQILLGQTVNEPVVISGLGLILFASAMRIWAGSKIDEWILTRMESKSRSNGKRGNRLHGSS